MASAPHPQGTHALYPPLSPYRTGRLPVDDLHTLHYEECGNPAGVPVVFLHGGPGGHCRPEHRRFFNPEFYRIILLDQRGCGQSTPAGELTGNHTANLVQDLETLRQHLGVARWLVMGGSWGSTLALAYGREHAQRCLGMVLRGVFLGSRAETEWFIYGMGRFFPQAWQRFRDAIPEAERGDLMGAYARRLLGPGPEARSPFALAWSDYETACSRLVPVGSGSGSVVMGAGAGVARQAHLQDDTLARLECHYLLHGCFLPEGWVQEAARNLAAVPAIIVQGRYDVICPPVSATLLASLWPAASLRMVDLGGHSAFDPAIASAIVAACDDFMRRLG